MTTVADQFQSLVTDAAANVGVQLSDNLEGARTYSAERMLFLSTVVDEPGFHEAVRREALNVALTAAGLAVDSADAIDREFVGTIAGGLAIAARALAGNPLS